MEDFCNLSACKSGVSKTRPFLEYKSYTTLMVNTKLLLQHTVLNRNFFLGDTDLDPLAVANDSEIGPRPISLTCCSDN